MLNACDERGNGNQVETRLPVYKYSSPTIKAFLNERVCSREVLQ
jgi:hypothetical protein